VGRSVNFTTLGKSFFLPLLFSPAIAAVLSSLFYLVFHRLRKAAGITRKLVFVKVLRESNHPSKIHNVVKLTVQIKLELSENDLEFLAVMNQFQLEGRYPDYIQGVYKNYKGPQTKKVIERVTKLRKCLLRGLP
jgi:hypothetical protein